MNTNDIIVTRLAAQKGFLGVITLNRPQTLNALTHEMIQHLSQQLDVWLLDADVKAILIESSSEKAFCAGGDILSIHQAKQKNELPSAFFQDEYALIQQIHHYPKPIITFLDGITMGGGVGLSVHASHRVGTEKMIWAMPETGIGFFPDVGGSYFLPRCPQQLGVYLGLTGMQITAADALALNFIDYVIPREQFSVIKQALLTTSVDFGTPLVVDALLAQYALDPAPAPLMKHADQIEEIFALPDVQAIMAELGTRDDAFSQTTLACLATKSPTSLKVTCETLQRGIGQTVDACLAMEYRVACHFLATHDFFEGIRATVIDKNQPPHWNPGTLAQVSEQTVMNFFDVDIVNHVV